MSNTKTIAIYGHQLSELDQGSSLEKLGASLIKTSHSAANYRLFAVSDTQAALCKVNEDIDDSTDGKQIRVELWEVSVNALLKLIDEAPDMYFPEKFNLSDGTESLALMLDLAHCQKEGYEDVSRFGGWERYLLKKAEREKAEREKAEQEN